MANVDTKPIWHAVVRYEYHRSMDFFCVFYWWNESRCFDTMEQAQEWAKADHPELPGFRVISIYMEAIPTLKHTGVSKYETAGRPTCTDESILGRGSY